MTPSPQKRRRLFGLELVDHTFSIPLDHGDPSSGALEVFAREVGSVEGQGADRPWLVFFQGGPGFAAPRPQARSGWLARAVRDYRVLLLDPRGTGRSTPLCARSLTALGSPRTQADYLAHFRADSIVRDAEWIRRELLGDRPWTLLGQSFGGFCGLHYLSAHPGGLEGALITGGLPGLETTADDVYARTYPLVRRKNERYYERYGEDIERVARIVHRLEQGDVRLPGGDPLSPRRFQLLGLALGMSDGFEELHYLFESAFVPGTDELSHAFLRGVENQLAFDTNPIYALLHEACYAQGPATRWSAERLRSRFPEFDAGHDPDRVLFTGEMVYPWFFEEFEALKPLAEAAELLAQRDDWPRLYDPEGLAENKVPVAAAVYYEDMYVPRDLSLETAERVGNLRTWVTSAHEHNGLRAAGEDVLGHLLALLGSDG